MDRSWMNEPDRLLSPVYAEGVKNFLTQARNHASGRDRIRCPCRTCLNNLWLPIYEVETHLFIKGINPNYTQWVFHGEDETTLYVSDDDTSDEVIPEDDYIDDMQHMLDDIRAGTFINVSQHNSSSPNRPPIPGDEPATTFDKLLDDARRPLFEGCTKFTKLSFIVKLLHIKSIGGWSIKSFNMLLDLLRFAFPDALLPQSYEESKSLERGLGFNYHKIHACPNDCILFWKENASLNECPVCKASRWMPNTHGSRVIPQKVLRHFPLKPRLQRLFMSAKIAGDMRWHKDQRPIDDISLRHPADSECWQKFDEHHSWFAANPRNVRLGLACDGFTPFNNLAKPHSIWPVILIPYNLPPWSCMKDQFFMTSLIIPGPKSPGNEIDVYLQPLIDELLELWENGVPTYDAATKETFMLHAALLWTINDFPAYGNLSGWSTKGKLACSSYHMWRRRKWLFNGKEDHRMPPRVIGGYDILGQLQMIGDVQFGKSRRKRKRKTKDNINSRRDLEILAYRKELHLRREGDSITMPHALYTLYGDEKNKFCEWLSDIKFPDGFSSNISNCVSLRDGKISGMKSHDCHVFLHRLLPIAAGGFLRSDIALALTELSTFFKELCARTLDVNRLSQLQTDIVTILCKLEMIFPPSFFDVMVHLAVHLPREAILGDVEMRFNRADRNIDADEEATIDGFKIFNQKVRPLGIASNVQLEDKLFKAAIWEHYEKCKVQHPNSIDRTHQTNFPTWFKHRIQEHRIKNPHDVSEDLYALACGPDRWVASYAASIINGKRFHTKQRELRRRTQNSGVLVTGDEDTNNADFYGVINNIIELRYMEWRRVYLFQCDWFDVGDKKRGVRVDDHMISVNMNRTWYKDEPFVLASQADQCFYIRDLRAKGNWGVVQNYTNRNVYNIPSVSTTIEDINDGDSSINEADQENESSNYYEPVQSDNENPVSTPLDRLDIPPSHIDAREVMASDGQCNSSSGFINDDMLTSGSGDADSEGEYSDEDDLSTDEESMSEK
ncbi:uncharacterized protein LOC122293820 [Carya illinoinensis]|uniref:uncharacterized protein LOC122293820 n=1 Tax=Carya illinoinensis TaxID=32201 RepID=UPI001C72012F|nr:uncharacterized protein LOC122293820 [Carya illinoinensis]